MLYCLKSTVVYALSEELRFFSTRYFQCLRIKLIPLCWCNLQAKLISNIQEQSYVIRSKLNEKMVLGIHLLNCFISIFYIPLGNHVYFCLYLGTN
jgi:hypothetical protein